MKEFKVNAALLLDVGSMKTLGASVNDGYSQVDTSGVETLSVANRYAGQCEAVKSLLDEYIQLVNKDTQEISEAIISAQTKDAGIARFFKK